MNIYFAFSLFSVIILIYWLLSEFFTMLFRVTGVPDEKARFQVISLLTGCGYTTRESELLVSSRSRRRLARIIMLFGYVFNVTIISTMVNVFISLKVSEAVTDILGIMIPLLAIAVIVMFSRISVIRDWLEDNLERLVGKIMKREKENSVLLLDYIGSDSIAQVTLHEVPEQYRNVPLAETGIKSEHNILVMLVDRGKAVPAEADTVFQNGDKITVFGNYAVICKVFDAQESFDLDG
jgi:hypothetical protein